MTKTVILHRPDGPNAAFHTLRNVRDWQGERTGRGERLTAPGFHAKGEETPAKFLMSHERGGLVGAALSRIVPYALLVLAAPTLALIVEPSSEKAFVVEMAKGLALMAFVVLMLQPILAARIKWMERPFGYDIVIRFHKFMAVLAACVLVAHPLLLTLGIGAKVLVGVTVPWPVWLGRATLLLVLFNVLVSAFQRRLRIAYERWRALHGILGPAILVFIFTHSMLLGDDLQSNDALRTLWIVLLAASLSVFIYHTMLRPIRLAPYRVSQVIEEAPKVWTVKMTPPEGGRIYDYAPGQFHFVTFHRREGLPEEEHHWTVSSSPTERGYVSSTIKALGDFTSTIGQTRPGDTATVQGAFGRFSYVFHPGEKDLVFIAGGIGVTPLRSMLRHMRDTKADRDVLFLYANRTWDSAVFREELAEMEKAEHPRLTLVHVLRDPPEGWRGEQGHITEEMIRKYAGENPAGKGFYVCGPPGLLKAAIGSLTAMGVRDGQIHMEIFSFLD
jgi:predicted ferric reductase